MWFLIATGAAVAFFLMDLQDVGSMAFWAVLVLGPVAVWWFKRSDARPAATGRSRRR